MYRKAEKISYECKQQRQITEVIDLVFKSVTNNVSC